LTVQSTLIEKAVAVCIFGNGAKKGAKKKAIVIDCDQRPDDLLYLQTGNLRLETRRGVKQRPESFERRRRDFLVAGPVV